MQIVRYTWRKGRISQLIPANVSLRITGAQQLHQVMRMIGGIGNMLLSIYSDTKCVRSKIFFVNLWGQVIALRGQILVSRTGDDPSPLKTSPCVRTWARFLLESTKCWVKKDSCCSALTASCHCPCLQSGSSSSGSSQPSPQLGRFTQGSPHESQSLVEYSLLLGEKRTLSPVPVNHTARACVVGISASFVAALAFYSLNVCARQSQLCISPR